jgi:putative transposase
MMPHDLPPYTTVYTYFDQWNKDGHWQVINARLNAKARIAAGRDPQPSLSVVDSQSVKTAEKGGSIQASTVTRKSKVATPHTGGQAAI